MNKCEIKQMVDTINKGDRLGHKFLQHVADTLELLESDNLHVRKIAEQRGQDIIRLTTQLETSQDLLSILRLDVESMDSDRTYEDFGKDMERLLSSDEVYEQLHWENVRILEAVTGKPYEPGYFKDKFTGNGG
ncbi:hypothetical protein GO013_15705 [Pseudodesulfovibrio sp. JC047]|uniref:hypothetical protein n=1 Tax=Pseudodesulfovibrio sp. JC047 TaxID=2683199 RepID=UPI0013D78BD0|nr:hypothetical protein [Pseudodesulfovibrio sp. JC047]NDV20856.1 hypothetical protein [Pseudodesulfovibrio sp. JC047]